MVRRLKKPTCSMFSMRWVPGLLGGLADQVLEGGEVLGEQRLGELGEVGVAVHLPEQLGELPQQLFEVDALLAHLAGHVAEGFAQVVVEARPEEVEELVVGGDLVAALDHGRAQGVLEQLAVVEGELVERLEGVDGLRHRDPNPALPEQVRELDDLLPAMLSGGSPSSAAAGADLAASRRPPRAVFFSSSFASSFWAFFTSPSYFRMTFSVSFTSSSSSSLAFSASSARAQSRVSLMDGVFFRSSSRMRLHHGDHFLGEAVVDARHLASRGCAPRARRSG